MFFDGEEARGDQPFTKDGLRGSRQYVAYAKRSTASRGVQGAAPIDSIKAMVLLDMIGDCGLHIPREQLSNADLYDAFADGSREADGSAEPFTGVSSGVLDDHIPFREAGVPSLDLIDFDYGPGPSPGAYWHTRNDTLSHVCAEEPRRGRARPRSRRSRGFADDRPGVPFEAMEASVKTAPSRVLLAAPRGYCAGVDRAVQTVEKALETHGPPVYVRKEIVHNKHVVEQLAASGAIFVDQETEVPEGELVVFSAHGVAPSVHANAEARNLRTIDATCPLVTKVHVSARNLCASRSRMTGRGSRNAMRWTFSASPASTGPADPRSMRSAPDAPGG